MKTLYDKIAKIYLLFICIMLFLESFLFTYRYVDYGFITNSLVVVGIFGFILYLFYKIFISRRIEVYDIFIALLAFSSYVSYYYAYDQYVASFGFINGREGMWAIFSYYVIFLVSTSLKDNYKIFLYLFTIFGIIQIIYGLVQIYDVNSLFGIKIYGQWKYAVGFLSNSNFFGSYCSMLIAIWLVKYFLEDSFKINWIHYLLLSISILGMIIIGTMSTIIAFIVIFILIMIYLFIYRIKYDYRVVLKKVLIIGVTTITMFLFITGTSNNELNKDIKEVQTQATEMALGNIKGSFGTGRFHIWKEAIKYYYPDYFYTGVGIDNFVYIGGHANYIIDSITDKIVFKAHNEYLQILVTEGIFKFLVYLLFLLYILIESLVTLKRQKNKDIVLLILLFIFVAYSIQAFFNFSITRVAPLFFMFSGFLINKCYSE